MFLLNPKEHKRPYPDERSREIMIKTIAFLENKGLKKIKKDYHEGEEAACTSEERVKSEDQA